MTTDEFEITWEQRYDLMLRNHPEVLASRKDLWDGLTALLAEGKLLRAEELHWIPVAEQVPTTDDEMLVLLDGKRAWVAFYTVRWRRQHWAYYDTNGDLWMLPNVTHWLEFRIPQPGN